MLPGSGAACGSSRSSRASRSRARSSSSRPRRSPTGWATTATRSPTRTRCPTSTRRSAPSPSRSSIDPGRRVYVRRINVVGNTKTQDEVVRRELRQLEGAWYDAREDRASRRSVERAGYFDDVEHRDPAGDRDHRPGRRHAQGEGEADRRRCSSASATRAAEKLIVQGSVSQANIFGSGKAISLHVNSGKVNKNYSFTYLTRTGPSTASSRGFDFYAGGSTRPRWRSATTTPSSTGAGVAFGYPVTEYDRINVGLGDRADVELDHLRRQPAAVRRVRRTSSVTDPVRAAVHLGWVARHARQR